MTINLETGLIGTARFCPSPHHDNRPAGVEVDLLVIHGISLPPGEFGTQDVEDFFMNQLDVAKHTYFKEIAHLKVSSHLFIRREGTLLQFVPLNKRAWHAGPSEFEGRINCNDFSIGVELEGTDDIAYTPAQYACLAHLTYTIIRSYPNLTLNKIVGHSDIAPYRKTDPGQAFDWPHYRQLVSNLLVDKQNK